MDPKNVSLISTLAKGFSDLTALRFFPCLYFIIPSSLGVWLYSISPTQHTIALAVFLFLLLNISQSLATAATYTKWKKTSYPSQSWLKVFLSSLVVFVLVTVGLFLILPAIYFTAVYLFVPMIALLHPTSDLFSILYRSKLLVQKFFWKAIGLVLLMILLDQGLEWGGSWLVSNTELGEITLGIKCLVVLISTVLSAWIALTISSLHDQLSTT